MPRNTSDITLAILAGGAGSRMGKPKGELTIGGQPILEYLLDRFNWPGSTMLVTAPGREHPPGCARFSQEVIDPVAGQGPLRGILTALENAMSTTVVVATVDMPFIEPSQLKWIADQLGNHLGLLCSNGERVEPFPSAFSTNALEVIRGHLRADRGVYQLINLAGFKSIHPPPSWPENTWINLNTPDDARHLS